MLSWPEEQEGRQLLAKLNRLDPIADSRLYDRANGEISQARTGRRVGRFIDPDGTRAIETLLDEGLVEIAEPPPDLDARRRRYARPTRLGGDVARVLLPKSGTPDWLKNPSVDGSDGERPPVKAGAVES